MFLTWNSYERSEWWITENEIVFPCGKNKRKNINLFCKSMKERKYNVRKPQINSVYDCKRYEIIQKFAFQSGSTSRKNKMVESKFKSTKYGTTLPLILPVSEKEPSSSSSLTTVVVAYCFWSLAFVIMFSYYQVFSSALMKRLL